MIDQHDSKLSSRKANPNMSDHKCEQLEIASQIYLSSSTSHKLSVIPLRNIRSALTANLANANTVFGLVNNSKPLEKRDIFTPSFQADCADTSTLLSIPTRSSSKSTHHFVRRYAPCSHTKPAIDSLPSTSLPPLAVRVHNRFSILQAYRLTSREQMFVSRLADSSIHDSYGCSPMGCRDDS